MEKNVVTGIVISIIAIIILVTFVGASMNSYQSSSDDLRRGPCQAVGCSWNSTGDGTCQWNLTGSLECDNETEYALAPLYARSTGIIPLVLLAVVLLVSVFGMLAYVKFRR